MKVTLTVNGDRVEIDVEPRTFLVEALRDQLGLTGTRIGCDTTSCGACTVHFDGKPVKSCTVLAVQADHAEITTIEGLASDDALHPVQEAFRAEHGLQCGYCTSGMVMATAALLADEPDPDDDTVAEALEGNLCRCTGYVSILRAVRYAAALARGEQPVPFAGTRLDEPLARGHAAAATAASDDDVEVV